MANGVSECNVPCGGGIKKRRRTCTSPPPANGGQCCAGDNVEAQNCNTEPCEEEEGKDIITSIGDTFSLCPPSAAT